MATREYYGQVGARPQIDSITVAGAWAAADDLTITLGNSALKIVLGTNSAVSTAAVAATIVAAINASDINGGLYADEVRYNAGLLIGEFQDVEAMISPQNTSVVLVMSRVHGMPFGTPAAAAMTVAETTAGNGALTRAAVQTATGPNDCANTANWSGGAIPTTPDAIVAKYGINGPKYNLPGSAGYDNGTQFQPDSITIDQTVGRGWSFGLPTIHVPSNLPLGITPIPYPEYRQVDAKFNADHSTPTTLNIGRGTGEGVQLCRFTWTVDDANQVRGIIHNTGTPIPGGMSHCVYIAGGATNTGSLVISKGYVALANGAGEALGLGAAESFGLQIGHRGSVATDTHVLVGSGVDLDDVYVLIQGGTTELHADIEDNAVAVAVLKVAGNGTIVRIIGSGVAGDPTIARLKILPGATVEPLSEMTITDLLHIEGTLDLSKGVGPITPTNAVVYRYGNWQINDPLGRLDLSNATAAVGTGGGA